jgi:hypothetical protein
VAPLQHNLQSNRTDLLARAQNNPPGVVLANVRRNHAGDPHEKVLLTASSNIFSAAAHLFDSSLAPHAENAQKSGSCPATAKPMKRYR